MANSNMIIVIIGTIVAILITVLLVILGGDDKNVIPGQDEGSAEEAGAPAIVIKVKGGQEDIDAIQSLLAEEKDRA